MSESRREPDGAVFGLGFTSSGAVSMGTGVMIGATFTMAIWASAILENVETLP